MSVFDLMNQLRRLDPTPECQYQSMIDSLLYQLLHNAQGFLALSGSRLLFEAGGPWRRVLLIPQLEPGQMLFYASVSIRTVVSVEYARHLSRKPTDLAVYPELISDYFELSDNRRDRFGILT